MIDLEDGECYSTAHHKGKRDHKCNSIRPRGNKSSGNLPIVIFEFFVLVAGWEQAAGNFHVSNKLVHLQRAHEQARRVEPQLLHLRHPPVNQSDLCTYHALTDENCACWKWALWEARLKDDWEKLL